MSNNFKMTPTQSISDSSGSPSTLYTASVANGSIVIGCLLSNKTSSSITVTVQVVRSSTTYIIVDNLQIPAGSAFDVIQSNKIVLNSTDSDELQAYASTASACDALVSVLEGVN